MRRSLRPVWRDHRPLENCDGCGAGIRLPAWSQDRRRMVPQSTQHGARDRGRRADARFGIPSPHGVGGCGLALAEHAVGLVRPGDRGRGYRRAGRARWALCQRVRAIRSTGCWTGRQQPRRPARHAWLPRSHVGALRDVGVDARVRRGIDRRRRRRRNERRNQLARCICRNRQRCGGLRDGRSHRRRLGKARTGAAMVVSGSCALAAGFAFGRPLPVLLFAVCWGFSIVADSAQFSALVAEHSPRTHVGTALTLQICLGFLLTMISMRLLPVVASATGWQWAFLLLVPAPSWGLWQCSG